MKAVRFIVATFLCVLMGGIFGVYAKDKSNTEVINEEILRFHIVANSNSQNDQNIKMKVRKLIFDNASVNEKMDKADVEKWFFENKNNLEKEINDFLKSEKCSYTAEVTVEKEYFDIRKYNNFILPAGNYDAVVVKLGKGEGKNFFCVMYPSLCMIDDVSNDVKGNMKELEKTLTREQIELIGKNDKETVIKFKIIEILDKFL